MKYMYLENRTDNHFKFYEMIQTSDYGSFEARWGRIGKPNLSSKSYPYSDWHTKIIEKHDKGYETIVDSMNERIINNVLKFNKLIDAIRARGDQSEVSYVMSFKLDYVVDEREIPVDAKLRMNEIWRKYKPKE